VVVFASLIGFASLMGFASKSSTHPTNLPPQGTHQAFTR
jgi:hypothetical protein